MASGYASRPIESVAKQSEEDTDGQTWLRAGVRAVLRGIAKFPQLNGQEVEVLCWNTEKQRWKCLLPKGGDVNVFEANLEPAAMVASELERLNGLLQQGHLFEAWQALNGKAAAPPQLQGALEERLKTGTYSEIVDGRLKLVGVDGKGMGYQAAKNVKKGDGLLFETATSSVLVPKSAGPQALNFSSATEDPWCTMARHIKQEKDEAFIKEHILSLNVGPIAEGRAVLLGTLENTTMECTREPGRMAFFAAAARFNHSCCPSAYADSSRSVCVVRALRDISKGEQVCISYVPVSDSLAKRREKLKMYSFDCDCERCQAESISDPQVMVPCCCGALCFTLSQDNRLFQVCEKCCATFDREEARHRLSKVTEANRNLLQAMRDGADPAEEVKKLSALESFLQRGEKSGIPPVHSEALFLYNHLAHLHYLMATQDRSVQPAASMEAFVRYKKIAISIFEEMHTDWTAQRDVDYFQVLHTFLKADGLSVDDKRVYAKKLADACSDCFGQAHLPDTLATPKT